MNRLIAIRRVKAPSGFGLGISVEINLKVYYSTNSVNSINKIDKISDLVA